MAAEFPYNAVFEFSIALHILIFLSDGFFPPPPSLAPLCRFILGVNLGKNMHINMWVAFSVDY